MTLNRELLPYLLVMAALLFFLYSLLTTGQAVELSISSNSAGQGLQNLSFVGDHLNVSIQQNSSWQGWNVTLGATA